MADCYTTLYIKNADQNKFGKWFETETDLSPYYNPAEDWDFYVDIEGGYGGYFWESLALKMICKFDGINFDGFNEIIWDDHLVRTSFKCDGDEIVLTRCIELPGDCDEDMDEEFAEEPEDMRALWEAENDIPYLVKFSVDEVLTCAKIYKKDANKKLKNIDYVKSVCAKHNMPVERFEQFASIINFKNR